MYIIKSHDFPCRGKPLQYSLADVILNCMLFRIVFIFLNTFDESFVSIIKLQDLKETDDVCHDPSGTVDLVMKRSDFVCINHFRLHRT